MKKLLSICNSYTSALQTASCNYLFRTALRLLHELFVSQFNVAITCKNVPTYDPSSVKSYIPKSLRNCSHVWLRQEVKKSSLQRPYAGPYKILSGHEKYFTLHINNSEQNVTIDRLKPLISAENHKVVKTVRFSEAEQ